MQNNTAARGAAQTNRQAGYDDSYDDYDLRPGHHYNQQGQYAADDEQAYDPRAYAPNPDDPYSYDQDGEPVYYEPQRAPLKQKSGGVVIVGAVLALALLGGAGAVGYKMIGSRGSDGQAPLIKADTDPVKTIPNSAKDEAKPGKAVYDRVDQAGQKSKIVSREEDPMDLPASSGGAPRSEGSRIIMPGATANAEPTAPATIGDEPRRVKTMTIRPDSALASVDPTRAPEASPSRSDPIAEMARTGAAPKTSDFDNGIMAEAAPPPAPKPVQQAAAPKPAPTPSPAPQRPAAGPAQTTSLQQTVTTRPAQSTPATPSAAARPTPSAPAAPRTDPAQVATVAPRAPAPAQTTAAPQPARAAAGGFVVQVTSQRSEADARTAYTSLQRKFPGVLGQYQPSIQTATVADRGTYYRVRVGPFGSSTDASTVCNNLRAAGGDCVVSRN